MMSTHVVQPPLKKLAGKKQYATHANTITTMACSKVHPAHTPGSPAMRLLMIKPRYDAVVHVPHDATLLLRRPRLHLLGEPPEASAPRPCAQRLQQKLRVNVRVLAGAHALHDVAGQLLKARSVGARQRVEVAQTTHKQAMEDAKVTRQTVCVCIRCHFWDRVLQPEMPTMMGHKQ